MLIRPCTNPGTTLMLIYDDIFSWEGFGGKFQLAAGRCRLRIFDLTKGEDRNVTTLKPIIVIASDLKENSPKLKKISVRSCASHIATLVVERFKIDPQRMIYIEYYPPSVYGDQKQFAIAAKYDTVNFVWHDLKALHPKWRPLTTPLLQAVKDFIDQSEQA